MLSDTLPTSDFQLAAPKLASKLRIKSSPFMSTSIVTKRIVIKFGSGILTEKDRPSLDGAQIWQLMRQVAAMQEAGHQVIVVTSGAVAAGLKPMGHTKRPTETADLQACAAVGQTKLMHLYEQVLRDWGLYVGQMLVTHEDFELTERRQHMQNTLAKLLANPNVVPVFNENDSVATEEIRFGDNDALSSSIAVLAQADLLILLTSVDGLLTPDSVEPLGEVRNIEDVLHFVRDEKGQFSVGGMATKLQAVQRAVNAGVQTVIANGRRPEQLLEVVNGGGICTRFLV
jgi:glutamate 5-kinase